MVVAKAEGLAQFPMALWESHFGMKGFCIPEFSKSRKCDQQQSVFCYYYVKREVNPVNPTS